MKRSNGKEIIIRETMLLIGVMVLISLFCRLWPLLLLMLLSLFVALIALLFRATAQPEVIEPKPVPESRNESVRIPTQNDVYDLAYSVILRRVTELVHEAYPQARWIWEASNSRQLIEDGEDVFILLNRAGGYNRARVSINNLQVNDVIFGEQKSDDIIDTPKQTCEVEEDMPENYELLAFQWVEAHIIELNDRCNEAIGEGKSEVLIKADELPAKDSWLEICKQLKKVEIKYPECIPEGIQINLTH